MVPHRIFVVRCDSLSPEEAARFGDVHERMARHINAAAAAIRVPVEVGTIHAIDGELPAPDGGALYVLTGSKFGVLDEEAWITALIAWVEDVHDAGARLYGICFGHQVIAAALGGRVGRSEAGWEVGCVAHPVVRVTPTANDRASSTSVMGSTPSAASAATAGRLIKALGRRLTEQPQRARLLMSHRDEVLTLPPDAIRWLGGATWPEQGFVLGDRVITVQGHPEYEAEQVSAIYERRRGVLGDALATEAIASTREPDDGLAVTAAVLAALLDTPARP